MAMRRTWLTPLVVTLLIAGVAHGIDDDCRLMFNTICAAGTTAVDLRDCGLVDEDAEFVQECVDNAGRDGVVSLALDWNEFKEPPDILLSGLDTLEVLDFSYNDITTLQESTFHDLTNVEALKLNNNALDDLPADTFVDMESLRYLWVDNDEELGSESFCGNGFPGVQTDNICCLEECGECATSDCASREGGAEGCCASNIEQSGVSCEDSGTAPCVVSDADPEDICSNGIPGIESNGVCCAQECGQCGGAGCANRPGGVLACCRNRVVASGLVCSVAGVAPCIIDDE